MLLASLCMGLSGGLQMGAKGGRFMNGQRGRKVVVCFSMSWTLGGYFWGKGSVPVGKRGGKVVDCFPMSWPLWGLRMEGKGQRGKGGGKSLSVSL